MRSCRFARIDEGFLITDVSPRFFVASRGQDVASGLGQHGSQLVAGFTLAGNRALLATMEIDAVLASLMSVSAPGRAAKAAPE